VEAGGAEKDKARMLRWGATLGGLKIQISRAGAVSYGRQKFGHFASCNFHYITGPSATLIESRNPRPTVSYQNYIVMK
jgi:hypothetical protein